MPYLTLTALPERHTWALRLYAAADDELTATTVRIPCRWLLRPLPRRLRNRWCHHHRPTAAQLAPQLAAAGWAIPRGVPRDGATLLVEPRHLCPECRGLVTVQADETRRLPDGTRPRTAACAGLSSCGWTGPVTATATPPPGPTRRRRTDPAPHPLPRLPSLAPDPRARHRRPTDGTQS